MYGIPSWAETVLRIDPKNELEPVTELMHPDGPMKGEWKWHGGVMANDGHIYGVPCSANSVLKIDTVTYEVSTFGDPTLLDGKQKWYGGLLGADGNIYCIPQNADSVLKIIPETQEVVLLGQGQIGPWGGWKWHGGVVAPRDGCIYGIPNNLDTVMRIDPFANGGAGEVTLFGDRETIKGGSHRDDGKYKYLGGVLGSDGCIYCMPGDADRVLKIIPGMQPGGEPDVCVIGKSFEDERKCQNKWQNGFEGQDGCIYGIPLKGESVLQIDIATQQVSSIQPKAGPLTGNNKWEGGVVGNDGCMYCMPLNSKVVLKIKPGPRRL